MNEFITKEYHNIMLMCKKICKGHAEWEDVAHFAISEFMQHERGQELVDAGRAMQFLSGIMWRSFHSSTSQYHAMYRQKGRVHQLTSEHQIEVDDDQYDYNRDVATEAICGILEDMKADSLELWFRAVLFEMWSKTPNYSELSRATLIPRTSISQAVEEARQYIKQKLNENRIDL